MPSIKTLFVGPDGVRAGWRFAAFAALVFASDFVLGPLLEHVYAFSETGFTPLDILVYDSGESVYLLAVSLLLARLERHRASWFGWGRDAGWLRLSGAGWLWGFAAVSVLFGAAWIGGAASIDGLALHGAEFWTYLAIWLGAMLAVGVAEELQFRGYALASLTRGMGFWPSALLLSLLFGGEHLSKPNENVPDILNIVLLGLFVCYSVRRTGSLWFAIGFHAAFDFFALAFYGSPNTGTGGLPLDHRLLDTHIGGPAWLSGGPQGLEASWLVPPLTLAMCLLLRRLYPARAYPPQ